MDKAMLWLPPVEDSREAAKLLREHKVQFIPFYEEDTLENPFPVLYASNGFWYYGLGGVKTYVASLSARP